MVKKNYQATIGKESKIAKAVIKNARVSTKYSNELCDYIRGKPVEKSISFMEKIISKEEFLPLKKYHTKVAHRKGKSKAGVKSGRYPKKVAQKFIELLELAKSNADFKGLDTDKLLVMNAFASTGFQRYSHQAKGRIGGKMHVNKSSHLEVVVMEAKG